MDCSCTVEMDLGDYCELLSNKWVKARKEHKCYECRRIIPPGEEYFKEATVYDRRFAEYKTCEDCYSIRQVFFSSGWYYGSIREQMSEFIWDCQGDISVTCIRQVTKPARDWILDIIQKIWDEMYDED